MSKFKVWVCKRLLRHVDWHKEQVKYYTGRLNHYLQDLDEYEFIQFGIETGYVEKRGKR